MKTKEQKAGEAWERVYIYLELGMFGMLQTPTWYAIHLAGYDLFSDIQVPILAFWRLVFKHFWMMALSR